MESTKEVARNQKTVPSISIEIINNNNKKSMKRGNSYPRLVKEEIEMMASKSNSRVQETLLINKLSLDRKLNADDVAKTTKPSSSNYSKNLKIKIKHETNMKKSSSSPNIVKEEDAEISCLSAAWNVKGRRGRWALHEHDHQEEEEEEPVAMDVKVQVQAKKDEAKKEELEYDDVNVDEDEDVIKAAETLLMIRRDPRYSSSKVEYSRSSKRKGKGKGKVLGFDLNHPPPSTPEDI